jgi:hypothetical protein
MGVSDSEFVGLGELCEVNFRELFFHVKIPLSSLYLDTYLRNAHHH